MFKQTKYSDPIIFNLSLIFTVLILYFYGFNYWLFVSLLTHVIITSVFSATIHRYYCHNAFQANENLMFMLAMLPAVYFYTSPTHWLVMHSAHHVHSDTDKDTHKTNWSSFFGEGYNEPPDRFKRLGIKLLRSKKHLLLHKYFLLAGISFGGLLAVIDLYLFMYMFVIPVFTIHLSNRLHRLLSHSTNGPTNKWYLEFLVPMGGEWIHQEHHDHPLKLKFGNRFFEFDPGYLIIKLVSQKS